MKVKWDITGKGDEAWGEGFQSYDGPVPVKGSYVCRIKRMTLGKINKEGENKGKPRISVLLEVVGGQGANGIDDKKYKYLGAPIWDGLNIIKAQTGRVNAFLHALTDGSDAAKRAVETAFWPPNGPKADKIEKGGSTAVHITQIGKYNIGSPDGQCLVRVITKMGKDLDGNPRAEVNNYIPYEGNVVNGFNSNGAVDDDDDGLVVEDDDEDDGIMDASDYMDDDVVEVEVVQDDEPPF